VRGGGKGREGKGKEGKAPSKEEFKIENAEASSPRPFLFCSPFPLLEVVSTHASGSWRI
jgi:hypothetical protein